MRAALAWAFGPAGDTATGISLAATSAPLWFALSRMAEFLHIAEQALAAMRRDGISDPLREMALCDAYGHALWHIRGAGEGAWATFQRALEIAEEAGSDADRLRALFGLWLIANSAGSYRQATALAERSGEIAARGPDAARLLHHRMMALSMHYSGQHERARSHAQRVLDAPITVNPGARNSGFHFDQRVAAHTALARIHWVLGFPDQAVGHAHEAVERALAIGHLLSLVYALATGCAPVAFWVGDWAEASRYTQMLERRAEEYSLLFWQAFGAEYRLLLERHEGSSATLDALVNPYTRMHLRDNLCTIDAGLADDTMLERGESGEAAWCAPELLRIKGERLASQGAGQAAEALFQKAIELARQHQAAAWELRCATSLARLHRDTPQRSQARAVLEPVLARFHEGAQTADVCVAASLLRELG